eukprot:scaffold125903_cov34-Tisochrysis_lutea.AAC.6
MYNCCLPLLAAWSAVLAWSDVVYAPGGLRRGSKRTTSPTLDSFDLHSVGFYGLSGWQGWGRAQKKKPCNILASHAALGLYREATPTHSLNTCLAATLLVLDLGLRGTGCRLWGWGCRASSGLFLSLTDEFPSSSCR